MDAMLIESSLHYKTHSLHHLPPSTSLAKNARRSSVCQFSDLRLKLTAVILEPQQAAMARDSAIAPAAGSESEEDDEVKVKHFMIPLRELVDNLEVHHPPGAPIQEAEHWDEMVSLSSRLVDMGANECPAPSSIVRDALNIHRLSKHQARMKQVEEIRKKLDAIKAKLDALEGRTEKLEHEVDTLRKSEQTTSQT